ncbi:MAG: helix-turn-helix domain-containing protein [Candidatus Kryptoniota bacterium]
MGKQIKKNRTKPLTESGSESRLRVVKGSPYNTRLRRYIDSHGIKLSWLAKEAQISYPRLYRLYEGATEPKIWEARVLVRLLNCRLEDIFELERPEKPGERDLRGDEKTGFTAALSGNHSSDYPPACMNCHLLREANSKEPKDDEGSPDS